MTISFKQIPIDNNKIPTKSGIYKITNIINGHFYIGQSCNIRIRILDHYRLMNKKRKNKCILYKAVDKHKIENFVFEILEFCDYDKLSEREVYYILKLNPQYNIIKSPQAKRGYHKASEKDVIEIYNLKNSGYNSIEITKKLKLTPKIVRDILSKKTYNHIIEKHDLKIMDKINNDEDVINLIKNGFLNVDIRLFFPNYNNRKIRKIKNINNLKDEIYTLSKEEYGKHSTNIKNKNCKLYLKKYCFENKLPISKFSKFIKKIQSKTISNDLIFKIYELAKKDIKRKEISSILNIPFREVIEVLREDGRSKYSEFKKNNNLYIERKRNFRKKINTKHEQIVLMVFDLYKKKTDLIDISKEMGLPYGMIYRIIFNKNRYTKIKEKHNLHPFVNEYINV